MTSRVWVLVEWLDDRRDSTVFPLYNVVDLAAFDCRITGLQPGNLIFLRRQGSLCQAKVLVMSESKQYVEEQLALLTSQDQQVFKVSLKSIKKAMTSRKLINTQQQTRSNSPRPNVLDVYVDSSISDSEFNAQQQTSSRAIPNVLNVDDSSDSEVNSNIERNKPSNFTQQSNNSRRRRSVISSSPNNSRRRRSVISSSPIPSTSAQGNINLRIDQETQTEEQFVELHPSNLKVMEASLKFIYKRFIDFVAHLRAKRLIQRSGSTERNNEASGIELNNTDGAEASGSTVKKNIHRMTLRVRRVSAQTTNNIEVVDTVPIGNGNARVPAKLLRDIDWTSHTLATRQLLDAVFPRRTLATHSLTGKPSPAFSHRPAKEILDPKIVDDIIKTVSKKSGVTKNTVRSCITLKCADEAKLYRNRQKDREDRKRQRQQNDESISPSSSSDESDSDNNEFPPRKRNRRRLSSYE